MAQILLNASSYVFIIVVAYLLKRRGLFGPKDYKIVAKITLNVTLPAAILTSFAAFQADPAFLLALLVGFFLNWVVLGIAFIATRNGSRASRALWYNCTPGFNIGAFALPFVQSFLSPASVVGCCLFDAGNAIMCTGGTYALTTGLLETEHKPSLKQIGRNLLSSAPFVSYVTMTIVSFLRIPIPKVLVDFVSPLAKANPFLAMFMVGTMFDLHIEKDKIAQILKILAVRFGTAILAALGSYFLLPLPLEVRQAIAIAVFAPVSVAATAFAEKAGADPAEVGCVNTLSIPIGVICIITLLLIFGVM